MTLTYLYWEVLGYNSIVSLYLKIDFVEANSVDPDDTRIIQHFSVFFTDCQSMHLGVTNKERDK